MAKVPQTVMRRIAFFMLDPPVFAEFVPKNNNKITSSYFVESFRLDHQMIIIQYTTTGYHIDKQMTFPFLLKCRLIILI